MALQNAPYWTDLYYDVVEHYFWRPQDIGRESHADKQSRPWSHWKKKLERSEIPLNHMVNFLFHIAPLDLLDASVSALLGRSVLGLDLVTPSAGAIDYNIVQPDIILRNRESLIFIEMKVDSRSRIDQFVKYCIAAHCLVRNEPEISSVDLVILSRHDSHVDVWKNARSLELNTERAVRELAVAGLIGQINHWKEKGISRFISRHPNEIQALVEQVRSIGLHLSNYKQLADALTDYAATEKTVSRLVAGVLNEFEKRQLVPAT